MATWHKRVFLRNHPDTIEAAKREFVDHLNNALYGFIVNDLMSVIMDRIKPGFAYLADDGAQMLLKDIQDDLIKIVENINE